MQVELDVGETRIVSQTTRSDPGMRLSGASKATIISFTVGNPE